MDHSLHRVSILKITAFYVFAFMLRGVAHYLMSSLFPEGLLTFLIEIGILLFIAFFTVRHLIKADISLPSVCGDTSVNKKLLFFSSALSVGKLILYFSFAGLVLRFFINRPEFISFSRSLLEDTSPTKFNNLSIITMVFLGPILEEFVFRGIILNKWTEKKSNTRALLLSSLLFGVMHIGSFIIPQLIAGLIYGIVYLKTKKLIYPIVMHILNNFLLVSINFIPVDESAEVISVPELIAELTPILNALSLVFIIALPVFIVVVYRYSRNINDEVTPFVFNSKLAIDSSIEK